MDRRILIAFSLCAALGAGCSGESDEDSDENRTASDPTCVSGTRWTGGDEESALMHPGGACISCHEQQGEGPKLSVAGTVFSASDEKLDCFGEPGVQVVIVGDDGQSLTLDTNSAGNFSYEGALAFPLQVKVVRGAQANEMLSPVTNGDCNGCHDETGQQGAPGRIVAP